MAIKKKQSFSEYVASKKKDQDIANLAPTRQTIAESVYNNENKPKTSASDDRDVWFKGSKLFDDGWQFGDVIGTIAGTAGDVGIGIVQGAANLVEGVADLGMYGASAVGGMFGAKDFAESTKQMAQQQSVNEAFDAFKDSIGIEDVSVFGGKADAASQGLGQVAGILLTGGAATALGASTGVTSGITLGLTGASSMGSGIGEAYDDDATDAEAWAYGAIKGGVDTVSEMIFGGLGKGFKALGISKGLSSIDDVVARKLSSKFSNQLAKNLVELGVKASAEGLEEVIAGIGTAVAKNWTYKSEEDIWKLLDDEDLLDQFISGAIVSAIAQSPDAFKSTRKGRSLVSNTTKNEDAVVQQEYNDLVAEAEKGGKKLSALEKNRLYDKALSNMDKGYISIDTIEKVLGGDDYKEYSDNIEAERALSEKAKAAKTEFDELNKLKTGDRTGEQTDRLEELRGQIKGYSEQISKMKSDPNRGHLKDTLSRNVENLAKDSRLYSSYVERANRGVTFQIDENVMKGLSEAKRKTYQSAIDNNFNNQNAVHDLVDLVANFSDKTNIPITFTDTKGLKEAGYSASDGQIINGVYTKDGIKLNHQSKRALNVIAGHEITHALEGTKHYQELQKKVFDYAKSKNDFDKRRATLEEVYKNQKDADIDAELTADLIGDYLFTDEKFIQRLASEDRNLAQRIYDSIKRLLKIATSGSREERELEKAKWAFEEAFREQNKSAKDTKTDTKKSEVKHSIGYHAGDLGKSESLGQQSGGRDTGHFGTGTYFVGDEAQISDSTYGKRPHYTVDFDKYTLYNPKTSENAGKLHEFLKGVNYYYDRDPNLVSTDDEIDGIKEAVDELTYDELTNESFEEVINLVSKVAGKYKTNDALWGFLGDVSQGGDGTFYQGDHAMTMQEVVDAITDKDAAAYKLQQLLDDSYVLRPIWRYQEWNESVAEASEMLEISEAEAREIISAIKSEIASAGYDYKSAYTADSASTRFMKALGYEGIDVRGIKGYDNTAYGSVIYDLQGEDAKLKSEIGTAKFSVSDEKTLDKKELERYNRFGWTNQNGILTKGQLDNFYSRFSAITANLESAKYQTTSSGEYMIPVSDIYDSSREGIQNVVVYAKGTLDNPVITAVIEIDADNETDLSEIRRFLYETERRGIKQETDGVFRRYDAADFGRNETGQNGFRQGTGYSNRFGTERGTSGRKTKGTVSYRTTKEGYKSYLIQNEATSDDGAFSISPKAKLSVSKNIDGKQYDVVDGVAVSTDVAQAMQSDEYKKPDDYMAKYSISTTPDWEKSYLEKHHDEKDYKVVEAIRDFTDKMVQDDAVRGYVPNGNYKYSGMGPLRSNVEYIVTFDMDTSCPRTFQFLNFRDAIQKKAGRYLTYNESINLLELMRAYGQQIPCCYCYVENKRVLLSASYNNFFNFRNAVMNAKTDADAEKVMYGYDAKKGLPDASRKALDRWRSDTSYNPTVTEVWTATNTARNSVLNYLDSLLKDGQIDAKTAQSKLNKMVRNRFGITDKAASAEIRGFVKDWAYDTLAGIPHNYIIENNTDVSSVDERALALNHEALAYAKSASSAKSVENYVPYTDQLKKISEKDREYIIGMGGIRKHSSNDFRMDYVQDYFLFYADLAANKWTGHTYTKSADFAKIFACTNDRINMSVAFYEDADGTIRENMDEGASWRDVKELRKAYNNVGSMAMVTSDNQLSYALNSDWIDMIIPFHASGLDKSVWYNLRMWNDYTTKQSERFYNAETMRQRLLDGRITVPKGANASEIKALYEQNYNVKHIYGKNGEVLKPHFFPGDTYVNGQLVPGHHNDVSTYFDLCNQYGVYPRFYGIKVTDTNGRQIDVTEHPSYIKLIKETARTDSEQLPIEFNFGNYDANLKMTPFEYAMQRLQEEAKIGGFENTKSDKYSVVDEFVKQYLGKDRPLGYLTKRAKKTRKILLEESRKETAKQDTIVDKEVNAMSQSFADEEVTRRGDYNVYGADVMVDESVRDIAPIASNDGNRKIMANASSGEEAKESVNLDDVRRKYDEVSAQRIEAEQRGEADLTDELSAQLVSLNNQIIAAEKQQVENIYRTLVDGGRNVDGYSVFVDMDSVNGGTSVRVVSPDGETIRKKYNKDDNLSENDILFEVTKSIAMDKGIRVSDDEQIPQLATLKQNSPANTSDIAPMPQSTPTIQSSSTTLEAPVAENESGNIATVKVGDKEIVRKKSNAFNKFRTHVLDDFSVFEDLALKTGNRELDAKANFIRSSEQRAQRLIGNGADGVKALKDIRKEVTDSGTWQEFYDYMHHMHNVDRMSLVEKGGDKNKPVFGDEVTAEVSRAKAAELEAAHPQFKKWAQDVYNYNNHLRKLLVEGGVISQDTADLWERIYPHYVPIRREDVNGNAVNVPLDTGRTGVNAPIKAAKGGSGKIEDMFQTMAMRTEQTYRAIAKNNFGIELKNTLQSTIDQSRAGLDETIDAIGNDEGLLQKGENGDSPTFTVFENGKRVTFEISDDMYEALKPTSGLISGTSKILNTASKLQRGVLTEYNHAFIFSNAIKDAQDVLMNSQHAAATYANFLTAIKELRSHSKGKDGKWITEYLNNGGEGLTYFDPKKKTFEDERSESLFKRALGWAPKKISDANNFIERIPRLAEYIASRKAGASIEVAMLDAARVTTNFAAGGDVTKWANRNGFTFLNASVQGFNQAVRNFREAKRKGLGGALALAAKIAVAGLPIVLLNHLLWDDDEEYEELSDYVKDNYYVVAKYGDGRFVRIPKGRALAVIQNAFEQMSDQITGDDEIDMARFTELLVENILPSNPLDNNVVAPIVQAFRNKTWYGDDLVPQRLQDLPNAEQYDETTDWLSKWLGETFNDSPYKINYVLDQYSGGVGDVFLPMMTPQAESGDSSFLGNLIAPILDKFTTDSALKNQNVSDFYDTADELAKASNSSYATDEDKLKYKYMSSVRSELSDLYKQKRELQNDNLPDSEKYEKVRELQKQIDELAKNALNAYENVTIDGKYATIGDQHYLWNDSKSDPGWQKLTDKQVITQNVFTSALDVSAGEYWEYAKGLQSIESDKDENDDSVSGSRKKNVVAYINSLDLDYYQKIILYRSEYQGDDTYNNQILEYLNGRNDLTYANRIAILKKLGFKISEDGRTASW